MYSHFTPCQHGHHELVSVLNRLAASRLQKQLQVWLAKGGKNKRAYSHQLEQCWYSKPQQCSLLQHHCSDKYVHSQQKSHARICKPVHHNASCYLKNSASFDGWWPGGMGVANGMMLMIINICCKPAIILWAQGNYISLSPDVASNKWCSSNAI